MPETGSRRRSEDIGETWPELPDWATPDALDADARRDLRGLSKDNAAWVAAHLVAASTLADEDPETAWRHARATRARGGRIGVVRETVGLVAYRAGEWAEAIGELRAARRMGGGPGHLAILADCERALGHPERAIELARSAQAAELDEEGKIELATVVAGARADLGQADAALAHLEQFGNQRMAQHPRLAYSYADLLVGVGRAAEALTWFIRAANADTEEDTDALDRVEDLAASLGAQGLSPGAAAPEPPVDDGARPAGDGPAAGTEEPHSSGPVDGADESSRPDESGHPGGAEAPVAGPPPGGTAEHADRERTVENEASDVVAAASGDPTVLMFSDDPHTGDR